MDALDEVCSAVRAASRVLGALSAQHREGALAEMADALRRRSGEILRENRRDVEGARGEHASPAVIDRLYLDEDRIAEVAEGVRAVAALPDPLGVVDAGWRRPSGLEVVRRRVPLGVVAVVHEARPGVTVDAAALCVRSGNAAIVSGGRAARRTNRILAEVLTGALIEADAPRWSLALLGHDREELRRLVSMEGAVDVAVVRAGRELTEALRQHARVPLILAARATSHVYVHEDADAETALKVAGGARPAARGGAETLLVHRAAAPRLLSPLVERMRAGGGQVRVDRDSREVLGPAAEGVPEAPAPGEPRDPDAPWVDVRLVEGLEDALAHIARHGSGHSEAIVTTSLAAAAAFQRDVDAAAVYVNASTRLTAGAELGMGADVGVSIQKVHARGPIGPAELTSYTYLVTGDGHVR